MLRHQCAFGDHLADPEDPETFTEITAWVSGPKKDGGVLRQQTGRTACKKCISAMRAGQDPGQPDLFTITDALPMIDKGHPLYTLGFQHAFAKAGYDSNFVNEVHYLSGYGASRTLNDYLDGFFFFQVTP